MEALWSKGAGEQEAIIQAAKRTFTAETAAKVKDKVKEWAKRH